VKRSNFFNGPVDKIIVIFPYNQQHLFELSKKDWDEITSEMRNTIIVASLNGIKKYKPNSDIPLVIMNHEKIINFWEDVKEYYQYTSTIKVIKVIVSDIDVERVKRDFNLIFSDIDRDIKVEYDVKIVSNSFWKAVYKMREKLVLILPVELYRLLGRNR